MFYSDSRDGVAELDYLAGSFVTEYAAKNVIEDMAESFAEWVVHPERWQANSIAGQKVRFFEAYPELRRLKYDIRRSL